MRIKTDAFSLTLLLMFFSLAAFPQDRFLEKFRKVEFPGFIDSKRPDPNENFFAQDLRISEDEWDPRLEKLEEGISADLVLPRSLLRTFLVALEHRGSHRLASGSGGNPSIHVLISDRGGSGVTGLVKNYLKAAGRPGINVELYREKSKGEFLNETLEFLRDDPDGVLIFEEFERAPPLLRELTMSIIKNRDALKNVSVIFILNSHKLADREVSGDMSKLIQLADSVHYVRRPLGQIYYRDIIGKVIKERFPSDAGARSGERKAAVVELAKVMMEIQNFSQTSQIRNLYRLFDDLEHAEYRIREGFIYIDHWSCSGEFGGKSLHPEIVSELKQKLGEAVTRLRATLH